MLYGFARKRATTDYFDTITPLSPSSLVDHHTEYRGLFVVMLVVVAGFEKRSGGRVAVTDELVWCRFRLYSDVHPNQYMAKIYHELLR
jgi:hypothetical protein